MRSKLGLATMFRLRALAVRKEAEAATTGEEREKLLKLAEEWTRFGAEAERNVPDAESIPRAEP